REDKAPKIAENKGTWKSGKLEILPKENLIKFSKREMMLITEIKLIKERSALRTTLLTCP
uniref:Uncharacterized protein n=1 Tax=Marmota marmota marmota TaxID=9994 RepID=A0A8C6ABV7_MARMA